MVYWLTRAAGWLAGKVPRPARLAFAGGVTTLVYYLWVSKRRATIANMAQILGVKPSDLRARRLARDSWRNYGRYLSDFFNMPNTTAEAVLARMRDVSDAPGAFGRIDEALARGKGIILVSAHLGAWDLAGAMVAAHTPLSVIADSFSDPRMDDLIQGQRASFGLTIIRAEKSPLPILRALKANKTVGVVADRPLAPGEGTPVTFFGATCYVPSGVAQLALLSGATVAPGFCFYDERYSETYYGLVTEPIIPAPTGDREADAAALTQQIFSAMEAVIRRHPDQWYMFRRFWPAVEPATRAARVAETPDIARQAVEHA